MVAAAKGSTDGALFNRARHYYLYCGQAWEVCRYDGSEDCVSFRINEELTIVQ